jgi:hypothetical protein
LPVDEPTKQRPERRAQHRSDATPLRLLQLNVSQPAIVIIESPITTL